VSPVYQFVEKGAGVSAHVDPRSFVFVWIDGDWSKVQVGSSNGKDRDTR
jgi:hypothetical protein